LPPILEHEFEKLDERTGGEQGAAARQGVQDAYLIHVGDTEAPELQASVEERLDMGLT